MVSRNTTNNALVAAAAAVIYSEQSVQDYRIIGMAVCAESLTASKRGRDALASVGLPMGVYSLKEILNERI